MDNFDYKKYSLENLENWLHDAISCSEATPQEIFDVIKGVVEEEYYCYKNRTSYCYELLALLNGNGQGHLSCDKDDKSPECQKAWTDFWEDGGSSEESSQYTEEVKDDGMRPWGHSDLEYLLANPTLTEDRISNFPGERYTEEELNVMCDAAEDKDKCREYNLREAEYYDKRARLDAEIEAIKAEGGYDWTPPVEGKKSKYYYEYDRNDPNRENLFKDRVVKWQLPIEVDGISGEYYVQFPDDLMEAANIKEDDLVEWVDQGDGSFLLKKVNVHS